jgi:hypothetical protein
MAARPALRVGALLHRDTHAREKPGGDQSIVVR